VGIEHPILGLMTFTLIAAMVVSAIVLLGMVGMNVHDYILKTPVTEGYATCFSESFDDVTGRYKYNVSIMVANSGRVDLRLGKLYVATEKGLVELRVASQYTVIRGVRVGDAVVDFEVILLGFTRDTELWAGQRGLIRINMVSDKQLYMTGGQYSVTAYLTTIGFEAFAVREARFKVGEVERCPTVPLPPPAVPLDIVRVSRAALYWDTFDTNPINSRLRLFQERGADCKASYVPRPVYGRSGLVYLEVKVDNRMCALLAQGVTLPNTGSIYVAFTALTLDYKDKGQPGLFGVILTQDTSLTKYYTGGFNNRDDALFVRVRIDGTTRTYTTPFTVAYNTWYDGVLVLSYSLPNVPGVLTAYTCSSELNQTACPDLSISRILDAGERLIPFHVGISIFELGGKKDKQKMAVYFDQVIVTVNARPWIVRVEGLQPGWTVTLKDSSGNIIDSATAGPGGSVELNVWGAWIIRNGVIELYDSSNNLLIRKSFPEILGGDVYRVTG
jgi:hypothetical protein